MHELARGIVVALALLGGSTSGGAPPAAAPPREEVRVRVAAPRSDGGAPLEAAMDPAAPAPVILVLRGPVLPVSTRREKPAPRAVALAARSQDLERERLEKGLRRIGVASASPRSPFFRRDFRRTVNAVALDVPPALWAEAEALPEVRALFPDVRVRATLEESVPLVGAPEVWTGAGSTGAGVRIALVDSGVDAAHPDLGGGFGPGMKIAGGYDFVNEDTDPADDNGHGTHVAGILAAKGAVSGVAPDATILAYKVLDARGEGSASDVVAALERVVDPDGDPATADAAHVANLSLGGPGSPGDPMSLAVDAAARAGVVCVVAAGNGGPEPYTVTSPGVARRALTVGAVDKAFALAEFSGRGPVPGSFAPKPDLVAPGAEVRSLARGGGRRTMSGTSMAAPHVAGAAALLLSLSPGADPREIAARLVLAARPLAGAGPLASGAGALDVAAAAALETILLPASLSLGHDDGVAIEPERVVRLRVRNAAETERTYSARLEGDLPAGLAAALEPERFTLAAGATRTLAIRLSSEPGPHPGPRAAPYGFEGRVVLESGDGEVARCPWIYTRVPTLVVEFDRSPWTLLVHDGAGAVEFLVHPARTQTIPLPQGTYDLVALFADAATTAVAEGVTLPRTGPVRLAAADAVHVLGFEPRGGDGAAFDPEYAGSALVHAASNVAQVVFGAVPRTRRFTDVSAAYDYESACIDLEAGRITMTNHGRHGIGESGVVTNDPESFLELPMTFRSIDPATSDLRALVWLAFMDHGSVFQGTSSGAEVAFGRPPGGLLRLEPAPYADYRLHLSAWLADGDPLRPGSTLLRFLPYLQARAATAPAAPASLLARLWGSASRLYALPFRRLDPDFGLLRFSARAVVDDDAVRLSGASGKANFFFLSGSGSFVPGGGVSWRLRREGELAGEGSFASAGGLGFGLEEERVPLHEPGEHALDVEFEAPPVGDLPCRAMARLRFDTARADRDVPALRGLGLFEGGRPVSAPSAEGGAEIRVETADAGGAVSARLTLFPESDPAAAVEVVLERKGSRFRGILPPLEAGAAVSIRLVVTDAAGNELEYRLSPAFRVGSSDDSSA